MWRNVLRLSAGCFLIFSSNLSATTYTVANGDIAGFRAAVIAANANPGTDIISLATNGDYPFSDYYPTANPLDRTALPRITSSIVIEGNGSVLRRADSIISIIPQFRLIRLSASGSLTLHAATIRNGDLGPVNGDYADSNGSGVRNDGGSLTIDDCLFDGNRNEHWAGAIYTTGPATITNSEFTKNLTSDGGTGAIRVEGATTLSVNNCQFTHNEGEETIKIYNGAQAQILSSSVVHAGAGTLNFGAGINVYDSTLNIANSTITQGSSVGITVTGSTVTITQCTLTEHGQFNRPGSGLFVNSGNVYLRNSILALNDNGPVGHNVDCVIQPTGHLLQNINNLIGDGSCSPAYAGDPKLGPLDYYGGPTLVYPLINGSIAIDHANDTYSETVDQRGVARPIGSHADIGAYEGSILDPAIWQLVQVNAIYKSVPYFIVCDPLGPITIQVSIAGSRAVPVRSINAASLHLGNSRAGSARVVGYSEVNRDGVEDLTVEFNTTDVYRGAASCKDVTVLELGGTTSASKQILGYIDVAASAAR